MLEGLFAPEQIYTNIHYLLNSERRRNFYTLKGISADDFSIESLETQLKNSFAGINTQSTLDEAWNAVVNAADGRKESLQILEKRIGTDIETWPQIEFRCVDRMKKERTLILNRDEISHLLKGNFNDISNAFREMGQLKITGLENYEVGVSRTYIGGKNTFFKDVYETSEAASSIKPSRCYG